ncbi:MFS transporter [Nocardia brasiliensis]|uniref:MFS transporter n=1 Tax=Nocardia brasiliensis TaxID=37326 RepID=UPI0018954948|nr:MFS transporter [Nocardia brasiliensis]MBF6545903.1 MFS transporter [Nocardia brasiliensis]
MRTRYLGLAVLCLAEVLVVIDNTIINIALPTLSRELGAGVSGLQWSVDAYTLTFAGFLLAAGNLGDRYGRRLVLFIGMAGFGVVSAIAASVDSLGALIAARAVLGVFAAAVFPATLALVTVLFTEKRERSIAVGLWAGVAGIAIACGPLVSGWLLAHFSWHSVFWINVPVAALAFAGTVLWVPEAKADNPSRLDVLGLVLSVLGVSLLVWSIIEAPRHGWAAPVTLAGAAGAVLALAAFVWWQLRVPYPLLDVRLFTHRRFAIPAAAISVAFFALFGFVFFFTLYFQAIRGYSTLETGVRALPYALGVALTAPVGMWAGRRFGTAAPVVLGLAIFCGGFIVAAYSDEYTSYVGVILPVTLVMGAGLGLVQGPATELLMSNLAEADMGVGAAINDTTREIGGALGVAVIGSVLASNYSSAIRPRVEGAGLPPEAADAAVSSVVGGLEVARRIPIPALREQAYDAVRAAFSGAIFWTSMTAAIATGAGALLVAFGLPWREGRHDTAAEPLEVVGKR